MRCKLLLSACIPAIVFAQEGLRLLHAAAAADSITVARSKIVAMVVQGNRRTKAETILREMSTDVGDSLDHEVLEADRKRIQNLGLFDRVEIRTLSLEKGVLLLINVSERWYFFPFPIFFYNENDVKKLSYGLGLVHLNLRGRAEQMQFAGWLGYNPGVQAMYHNPWIFGNAHLFTTPRFYFLRQRSKSFQIADREVDERQVGGSWTIGKRFGLRTFVSVTLGYRRVKFDPPVPGETLGPAGDDRLPEVGLNFLYDARDLFEYPRQGMLLRIFGRRVGFGDPNIHYWRYGVDVRAYQPLFGGLSLCLRAHTDLSSGRLPIYDRVFFGFDNRIRGHYYRKIEGENSLAGSGELRLPLLPIRYHDLNTGFLGQYSRTLKFGVSLAVFADTGTLWFQGQDITAHKFLSGYGASLDVHLPYVELMRVGYAINDEGKGEGMVVLGVSF